jgi:hypothetical protein
MRRMRSISKGNSAIKRGVLNISTISGADISYIQRTTLPDIRLQAWAKFDEVNFDGISAVANLFSQSTALSLGSCSFSLYSVAQGNSWATTLVATKNGSVTPNGVVVDFAASEIPPIEGDITFKLVAVATRQNKRFHFVGFFNHLGSLELADRNRRNIQFIQVVGVE